MSYKNKLGYVTSERSKFHVCGFKNGKVLIQTESGGDMKGYKIYETANGAHFNYKGKKVYLGL